MAKAKPRKLRVAPLADLLRFRFEEPMQRFYRTWYVGKRDLPIIWKDLMRYLWLTGVDRRASSLEPPRVIDEMWHMFLVYTVEYHAWSEKYFGAFVHHIPKTAKEIMTERRSAARRTEGKDGAVHAHIMSSVETVWDRFGRDTALRWYVTYPAVFDSAFFDRRQPAPPMPKIPDALVALAKKKS